jgi:hypothetical protein
MCEEVKGTPHALACLPWVWGTSVNVLPEFGPWTCRSMVLLQSYFLVIWFLSVWVRDLISLEPLPKIYLIQLGFCLFPLLRRRCHSLSISNASLHDDRESRSSEAPALMILHWHRMNKDLGKHLTWLLAFFTMAHVMFMSGGTMYHCLRCRLLRHALANFVNNMAPPPLAMMTSSANEKYVHTLIRSTISICLLFACWCCSICLVC